MADSTATAAAATASAATISQVSTVLICRTCRRVGSVDRLFRAVERGHALCVQYLLTHGANTVLRTSVRKLCTPHC